MEKAVIHIFREDPELKKWTKQEWLDCLEKGSNKKICQYRLESSGYITYMRAIQGDSGGNKVVPSLYDNVEFQYYWIANIYHVVSFHYCNSIFRSGLIAGGKDVNEGRQTVFFTAVDPMNEPQSDKLYDVNQSRVEPHRRKWEVFQNAVYWFNLKSAQDRA